MYRRTRICFFRLRNAASSYSYLTFIVMSSRNSNKPRKLTAIVPLTEAVVYSFQCKLAILTHVSTCSRIDRSGSVDSFAARRAHSPIDRFSTRGMSTFARPNYL